MKNPKITVVTVTYNAEAYLEQTILSIIGQDYPNIEYIIIDGGSNDGTVDIIKKYENNLIYWTSEPDNGIYHAMNKGIEQATGEWINFMNAGDTFALSDVIKNFIQLVKDDTDIAYGDSWLVHPFKEEKIYHPVKKLDTFYVPEMPFIHQSVFVRSSVMKQYKYREDFRFASDFDFFFHVYQDGYRYQYLEGMVISEFLGGGLHAYNMPQYVAECINSLVQYHENPLEFVKNNGVSRACKWFYEGKKLEFNRSLGLLSMQLDEFSKQYSRIVVYGYGSVGKIAVSKLGSFVVAVIDRMVGEAEEDGLKFISMESLGQYEYDIVLVTVLGREEEIINDLISNEVSRDVISILRI